MATQAIGLVLLAAIATGAACARSIDTELVKIDLQKIAGPLEHPWGMAFLPGGDILVTERPGRLRLIRAGKLVEEPVAGAPNAVAHGQGGMLDVALHPGFAENNLVYISYAGRGDGGVGTEVARGRWDGTRLNDLEVIFRLLPKSDRGQHFGSRLVFDGKGHLYITLGDRGEKDRAQDLGDHAGSVIRLNDDGSIPGDNPFVSTPGARPEIYSYGHRNIQGAALNPETDELWTQEHGPQGGDEINRERPGLNYGWPVITYGVNYGIGTPIGEGTHKEGMEQPLYYWVPSIAPSGMAFYTGDRIPQWQGNLFIGALKFRLLVRLEIEGTQIVHEERLLEDEIGRIRDVRQGPDGLLYLLSDEDDGALYRLSPAGS